MTTRILFVDDEFNVLAAIKRQLHNQFEIEIARGGQDALARLQQPDRFAVVVTDLRMPGVDGLSLLARVRKTTPQIVRILFTGQSDANAFAYAVNECEVFRILSKPCETGDLAKALRAALDHYRISTEAATERTAWHQGSIDLLYSILETLSPASHQRAKRLHRYMWTIMRAMKLEETTQYELAARLSQLGYISLTEPLVERLQAGDELTSAERDVVNKVPAITAKWLGFVPSLASVAAMVAEQDKGSRQAGPPSDMVGIGVRLLRVVLAFDSMVSSGVTSRDAIARLRLDPVAYPVAMVTPLESLQVDRPTVGWVVGSQELKPGMIFEEEIRMSDGHVLATRLQEATPPIIERIQAATASAMLSEPFRVRVPAMHP